MKNEKNEVLRRFENIAKKVYRGNKNGIYMLINDLEEFFEMNKTKYRLSHVSCNMADFRADRHRFRQYSTSPALLHAPAAAPPAFSGK